MYMDFCGGSNFCIPTRKIKPRAPWFPGGPADDTAISKGRTSFYYGPTNPFRPLRRNRVGIEIEPLERMGQDLVGYLFGGVRRTYTDDDRAGFTEFLQGAAIEKLESFSAFSRLRTAPFRRPVDSVPAVLRRCRNGYSHIPRMKDTDVPFRHNENPPLRQVKTRFPKGIVFS